MKKYLCLGFTLFITACATGPTEKEIKNADFGSEISQKKCESIAGDFIRDRLKDPDSAKFKFNQCEKGFTSKVPILGLPIEFGYMQTGLVNAKNSYGGYTGNSKFMVLIKNGKPVRYCMESNAGNCFIEEA